MNHFESCVICGKPLVYFDEEKEMECEICHQIFKSNVSCTDGHYICDHCHSEKAINIVYLKCLGQKSKNPIDIFRYLIKEDAVFMHGPEHHVLVAASLLTAYYNAGGNINLKESINKAIDRGSKVPGGACGFFGSCGAGVSSGIFISIITSSTPLSKKEWQLCNLMTSRSLKKIALAGGPRCCKRNSYLALLTAIDFVNEISHIKLEKPDFIECFHSPYNKQCLKKECPFYKA